MALKKRRPTSGYRGSLARPLPPLPPKSDPRYEVEEAARRDEIERRAKLLAAHHGVTDGDPYSMLTALMVAHVPGFRLAKKAGRKRQWFPQHCIDVCAAIEREFLPAGYTVTKAAAELAKRQPWLRYRATGEVLRRMYYAGKKVLAETAETPESVKKLAAAISSRD